MLLNGIRVLVCMRVSKSYVLVDATSWFHPAVKPFNDLLLSQYCQGVLGKLCSLDAQVSVTCDL